jgi:hypothetical protein
MEEVADPLWHGTSSRIAANRGADFIVNVLDYR